MSGFEKKFERLELKYLIDEFAADRVRRAIEPFCRPDSHSAAPDRSHGKAGSYMVSSLYLDTPNLAFHRAKERGDPERLKLRIRTYPASGPDSPTVFEIKRKVADVIDKTRAVVTGDVERAATGFGGDGSDDAARGFLTTFARLVAQSGAHPTLRVCYGREAYSSTVDDYARVTFDRDIEVKRTRRWHEAREHERWHAFDDHWRRESQGRNVLLELKCQSVVPWWLTHLIRSQALKRVSFSKYSVGIHVTNQADGLEVHGRRSARVMR
jgi:SPX domain protein involved in polyphosphate accumulation